MSKEINTPQNNSEEVDLGQLFKLIGKGFERLFGFISSIFNKLFLAFVWTVFFVKKHILKLVIAGIIGFGYGLLKENNASEVFKSSIVVKQNYNTGESLYKLIDYCNNLIKQEDFGILTNILEIDLEKGKTIKGFDVYPVINENHKKLLYNEYLEQLDSTVAASVDYEEYVNNLEDYYYKQQEIVISSSLNSNFENVFGKIVENINSLEYYVREQQKDIYELEDNIKAIKQSLISSDSLQKTYKKVLERSLEDVKGSETSITIEGNGDDQNKTREFDLYKNDLELRKELVNLERKKRDQKYILEVLTSNQETGYIDTTKEIFDIKFSQKIYYSLVLIFLTFLILFISHFIKFLEKFKSRV